MGLLAPDLTKPVTLRLGADDVKREALGRTLSIAGAAVGIAGGLMFLSASPAVKAALKRGEALSLTLQPAEARREAMGKSLALIGTSVSVVGAVIAFASDPKTRARVPALAYLAKPIPLTVLGLALAGATAVLLRQQNANYAASRYAS